MLLPNDISNLLTVMVTWDNSFQYENMHIKTKGKTLDNWLYFYLSDRRVLAEVAGCRNYFALTLIWHNMHFQVWREMFMKYSLLEYSEFILAFQLQFGIHEAENERFWWEKEKHHLNEWFIFWLSCWCSISEASIWENLLKHFICFQGSNLCRITWF